MFVYDHFGGCGYLGPNNVDRVAYRNLSGRGEDRPSTGQIADELVTDYDARRFHHERRAHFVERYSLERAVPAVLATVGRRDVVAFDPRSAMPHLSASSVS